MGFLMPPHPLTILKCKISMIMNQEFNGFYSRKNLPKTVKDGGIRNKPS